MTSETPRTPECPSCACTILLLSVSHFFFFFLSVSVRPIQAESKLNEKPYVCRNNKIKVNQIYKVNFKKTTFSLSGDRHCIFWRWREDLLAWTKWLRGKRIEEEFNKAKKEVCTWKRLSKIEPKSQCDCSLEVHEMIRKHEEEKLFKLKHITQRAKRFKLSMFRWRKFRLPGRGGPLAISGKYWSSFFHRIQGGETQILIGWHLWGFWQRCSYVVSWGSGGLERENRVSLNLLLCSGALLKHDISDWFW